MEDLLQRAAGDLIKARYGIALTGAGISIPFGLYSPPLAASSSFRRKPESRRPDWIPHQVRNDRI